MLDYVHVDVFSKKPLSGNGLIVVFDQDKLLSSEEMLAVTQEFNQFETVFINQKSSLQFNARIFTVEEELEFAGHPILGATSVIHNRLFKDSPYIEIEVFIRSRCIPLKSKIVQGNYYVEMDQGEPDYVQMVDPKYYNEIVKSLNITLSDLDENYPLEVISTGLPYLLVPITRNIEKTRIIIKNFEKLLLKFGAKFIYIFDVNELECRTWDNQGKVEDVATGSAAGPLCAYLVKHGLRYANESIIISQGKFIKRPSVIYTEFKKNSREYISIGGDVCIFAWGKLEIK